MKYLFKTILLTVTIFSISINCINAQTSEGYECNVIEQGSLNFPQIANVADFDGDGLLDIFVSTSRGYGYYGTIEGTNHIAWYKNLGNKTYKKMSIYTRNVQHSFVEDFDNDGDPDILYGASNLTRLGIGDDDRSQRTTIVLLVNDGNGNFESHRIYEREQQRLFSLKIADFNNDGLIDFYTDADDVFYDDNDDGTGFEERGYTMRLFLNEGDGDFDRETIDFEGHFDNTIIFVESVLGDFDGDNDIDVVVRDWNQEIGSLEAYSYLFDGEANFTKTRLASNNLDMMNSIEAVDIDNDGDLDVRNLTDNGQDFWYENDGSGNFSQVFEFVLRYENEFDFDGDGDIDRFSFRGLWQENIGNNEFIDKRFFENLSNIYSSPVDIDNDGDLDIVVSGFSESNPDKSVYIYENDGSQNFTRFVQPLDGNLYWPEKVQDLDLDLDGDLDILAISLSENELFWYQNDGSQNFTKIIISDNIGEPKDFDFADFDQDGDIDIITLATGDERVNWWKNDGNQNFSIQDIQFNITTQPTTVKVIDVNKDGFPDFMAADEDERRLWLYTNDQQGAFLTKTTVLSNVIARTFELIDLNNDGFEDLIVADEVIDALLYYRNDEGNGFTFIATIGEFLDRVNHIEFGDVDNDGDLDIFSSSFSPRTAGFLELWVQESEDNFNNHFIALDNPGFGAISAGDYDGDGDIDLLASDNNDSDNALRLYLNEGDYNFSMEVFDDNFIIGQSLVTTDLDDDGSLDVLAASIGSGIKWYEQTDSDPPATLFVTCPNDITLNSSTQTMEVFYGEPQLDFDCSDGASLELIEGPENGGLFEVGINLVVYEARDMCGSEPVRCSTFVTVNLESIFDVFCPADISLTAQGTSAVATWDEPTFDTNCPDDELINIVQVEGPPSGSSFPIGTTVIIYEIGDECDNIKTCSFNIIVQDTNAGIRITCPDDINLTSAGGPVSVLWQEPVYETTCPDQFTMLTQTGDAPSNGGLFKVGTTTVSYTATDNCNNSVTCSFDVTIEVEAVDCPNEINGFQYIGGFEGDNYFISNDISTWEEANQIAQINGGHLVSINSIEENNFIFNNINEITFIGFNDARQEGSFEWANGDVPSFGNVTSFNSNERDYAYINFWNGEWNLGVSFEERKFIMEVNCNSYSSCNISANINMVECDEENLFFNMTVLGLGDVTEWKAIIYGEEYTGDYNVPTELGPFSVLNTQSGLGFTISDIERPCNATVSVEVPECPGETACPDELDGYSLLGEFEGQKYFISDILTTWQEADEMAKENNGHLVSINNAEENSFIENLIFEYVFIGLTDFESEGSLGWRNEDLLTYTNFTENLTCFFCAPNTEERDFAHMNFWNGGWSFDGPFVERRHILEFKCGGFGSGITVTDGNGPVIVPRMENEKEDEIILFPNPVLDQLFVNINASEEMFEEVIIYDARGALVYQKTFQLKEGSNQVVLDVKDIPEAMYFLKFSNLLETIRFVKKN